MQLSTDEATTIAKGIVVTLCGSRWVSPPVRMTDRYPIPISGQIFLSGRPVVDVHSVSVDGTAISWQQPSNYMLTIDDPRYVRTGVCCGANITRYVDVDYTYGTDDLPPVISAAVDELAQQLLYASEGNRACRIPERVTSVSRQGMSWTLIDPQDFLQDGRTGIYLVDLAIKTYNPKGAKQRARIFTADMSAPALRRKS